MRKAWTPEQIDTFMVELKRLFIENPRASFAPTAIQAMKNVIPAIAWKSGNSIGKAVNWSAAMKASSEVHGIFKPDVQVVKVPMVLHEVHTDLLIAEMLRRFSHVMKANQIEAISAPLHRPVKLDVSPAREKKPIILVVGLLGSQVHEVQMRMAGLGLDLKFAESERFREVAAASRSATATVCMTKFINHSVYTHLKKHGHHLLHCNGGITDLVKQIKQNFVKQA